MWSDIIYQLDGNPVCEVLPPQAWIIDAGEKAIIVIPVRSNEEKQFIESSLEFINIIDEVFGQNARVLYDIE